MVSRVEVSMWYKIVRTITRDGAISENDLLVELSHNPWLKTNLDVRTVVINAKRIVISLVFGSVYKTFIRRKILVPKIVQMNLWDIQNIFRTIPLDFDKPLYAKYIEELWIHIAYQIGDNLFEI